MPLKHLALNAIELEAHALRAFAHPHAEPDFDPQGDRGGGVTGI